MRPTGSNPTTATTQAAAVHTGVHVDREWARIVDELARRGFLAALGAAPALLDEAAAIRGDVERDDA